MALTVTVALDYSSTNGGRVSVPSFSKSVTPVAEPAKTAIITVGGTDETLSKGDIGTIKQAYFRVLDTDEAKYVEIGADGTNYPIRVWGGGPAATFAFNGTDVHAKASTSVKFQYALFSA